MEGEITNSLIVRLRRKVELVDLRGLSPFDKDKEGTGGTKNESSCFGKTDV